MNPSPPPASPARVPLALPGGALILALVLTLAPGHLAPGAGDDPPRSDAPGAIYRPLAADFRPAYDRDPANGRLQTWPTYWSWVETYYRGNILANGWIKETETSLAAVTAPAARAELLKVMNEAGQLTSREWARDGTLRRISTGDLITWGNRLKDARTAEKGTGADLLPAVRLIHEEVKRKVTGPPPPKPVTSPNPSQPRKPQSDFDASQLLRQIDGNPPITDICQQSEYPECR